MKTRILQTSFWKDNYISELSPKEKLLFIYLLTNDAVSITGMYQLPDKYIKAELELTTPELEQAKEKLIRDGKFYFKDGWIKIVNYEKYNQYSGSKNDSAKDRELTYIPKEIIEYQYSIDRVSGDYSAPADSLSNHNHKSISNQKEKGIVKGKNNWEEEIYSIDLNEIAESYHVPLSFVQSKLDDLVNYCQSTGKRYKDYTATLRNWVKQDAMKIKKENKPRIAVMPQEL